MVGGSSSSSSSSKKKRKITSTPKNDTQSGGAVWVSRAEYEQWKKLAPHTLESQQVKQKQKLIDVSDQDHHNHYFKKEKPDSEEGEDEEEDEEAKTPPPTSVTALSQTLKDKPPGKQNGSGKLLVHHDDDDDDDDEEEMVAEAASAFLTNSQHRKKAKLFVKMLMAKNTSAHFKDGNVYVKKKKIGPLAIVLANLFDRKIHIRAAQHMHLLQPLLKPLSQAKVKKGTTSHRK